MPLADFKTKVIKAKDATVTKVVNTKDRMQSTPSAKTNWDYSNPPERRPPPIPLKSRESELYGPPPTRQNSKPDSSSENVRPSLVLSSRLSVPNRSSKPVVPTRSEKFEYASPRPPAMPARRSTASIQTAAHDEVIDKIDWVNISAEDKEVFFSWLDEYFTYLLGRPVGPGEKPTVSSKTAPAPVAKPKIPSRQPSIAPEAPTDPASATPARKLPPALAPTSGPPPIAMWSKPKPPPTPSAVVTPAAQHARCAALDLAEYFDPSTPWPNAWYKADGIPPPLEGSTNMTLRGQRMRLGNSETYSCGVLFSDLSGCWFSVSYDPSSNDPAQTQRTVKYLPPPQPLDNATLMAEHETYGETIAAYAESVADSGEDFPGNLASAALKYFDQFDYIDKPVPTIHRTHGHLIFYGSAETGLGHWIGGDPVIRRGDIIEWHAAMFNEGWRRVMGDHTSIVVKDRVISYREGDFSLGRLGILNVVELVAGMRVERKDFDMDGFVQGEIYVYRPVSAKIYLGFEVDELQVCPPNAISV
ncbi:hypothetical protein NEOLEDRAFT_1134269 [Neolentinus lepideus HHB14362 ss-1]|uniref:BBC1/AIM3 cysteine proteinase-fold domain-containing protein n=1 Tax=Neolentinus lepideus HHB14362 ss-1 TaxID=1314782 RepID=A0A165SEP5_9AGAM|nr:hypothetical protein NEOLEDRAFT_1134269 [Neolentinus lepideus HHB14362 ss-1]